MSILEQPVDGRARATVEETGVCVVGAGLAGIGVAIALRRAGFNDLVLVDEADEVGGTWHWNRYPGVGVDIPTFSYQYSFDQRSSWSRIYPRGEEVAEYARSVVDRQGLRPLLRLGHRITDATFDGDLWTLETAAGPLVRARHLVLATGVLTQPKPPAIPGVGSFAGRTVHTARWDPDLDLRGKRVGIIGTGASAVQLVPTIAEQTEHLTVFQRTPIWCLPKPDAALPAPARAALRHLPGTRQAARAISQAFVELHFPLAAHYHRPLGLSRFGERLGHWHLARQVIDPGVRAQLTPQYALGCKRPSFSNTYLPTFNRPDVHLETRPITGVAPEGVDVDGDRHELDVLVLATGFKVFEPGNMPPFRITSHEGVDLERWWDEHRYQAYEGVSVPGFPNMFAVLGPYGYNGASYFTLIENQSRHIVRVLSAARRRDAARVEVSRRATERFIAQMRGRRGRQVFAQASCGQANSYYFDRHGDVPFRASSTVEAAWRSARFPMRDYTFDDAPV